MLLGSNGRIKVLKNILTFLDMPLKTNHNLSITYLHQIIYWFLGENVVMLCGIKFYREEKKRLEESDGKKKPHPTQHHRDKKTPSIPVVESDLPAVDLSLSEKRKSAVVSPTGDNLTDSTERKERKPHHITTLVKLADNHKGGSLTSRPSQLKADIYYNPEDASDLPQGMANPLLRTVIMRLQYSVAFGSWEVRLVCLRALAKIAFLANFEVKLHLYSFFQTICKDQSVGLAAEALPIFTTLYKIFIAFSDYVKTGTNLTNAKKTEINNEIRQFCSIPQDFHPLGIYPLKKSKTIKENRVDDSPVHRHSVILPPNKK
jgi:hypothetical protein